MLKRRKLLLAPVALVAVAAIAVGSAVAATSAPKNDRITVKSGVQVKPGFYIKDMLRYSPYVSTVRAGGTITISSNKAGLSEGPHTWSLVKKSQLPKTSKQVNDCKVCNQIAQAQGADPNSESPPTHPLVDGGDGFNKPGDTVFFDGTTLKLPITAKAGTTLYYICALHPWMQGSVKVLKK